MLKRKFRFLLALIALFICLSSIEKTYAKYVTAASGNADISISRWNIKLNDFDITNGSNFSSAIIPAFNGNDYIAADIIAPGAEGQFDITIDGSETDTAYSLDFAISVSGQSDVKDLIITKYTIGDDLTEYTYDGNLITNFNLTDEKNITYHFFVKWNDDDLTETMNNSDDTTAAVNNGKAIMDINIKVTQLVN
ncbi:MAG: hypothetical protein Q4C44_03395 [bacterium]|nr:hypothetical protein [bacterium]